MWCLKVQLTWIYPVNERDSLNALIGHVVLQWDGNAWLTPLLALNLIYPTRFLLSIRGDKLIFSPLVKTTRCKIGFSLRSNLIPWDVLFLFVLFIQCKRIVCELIDSGSDSR